MLSDFVSFYYKWLGCQDSLCFGIIAVAFPDSLRVGVQPGLFKGSLDLVLIESRGLQAGIAAGFFGIDRKQGHIVDRHEKPPFFTETDVSRETIIISVEYCNIVYLF